MSDINHYEPWPELTAEDFNKTSHLLYMTIQAIGKLMLHKPFEPHWAHLAMPLTSRGITTGTIPFLLGSFSVDVDFIDHVIICSSSWGQMGKIKLHSMSVAELTNKLFETLTQMGVNVKINKLPQEMSNAIPFDQDTAPRMYNEKIVNAWWRIMVSTYSVLLKYRSRFYGITPNIGLLWGTLDLRDARYKGLHLPKTKDTSSYIGRNSMDDAQVEVGWSCSNEKYPYPSFFAFAYPYLPGLENEIIKPEGVKWVSAISEFVLDYDILRKSKNPESDLLLFFESYYQAVAKLDQWDPALIVSGKPITKKCGSVD
ncbi:MAG: DUF5996 family protein [Gammaproteobacteria bacterium]|nr:DUF5996 family protein [Gammaproteobacteria bacterium]